MAVHTLSRGAILTAVGFGAMARAADAAANDISHSNAAIHQEITFSASVERVYRVLTITEQFDKVTHNSMAMNSSMKAQLGTTPTQIDAVPGGAFTLFGGYISGRNLELVLNQRLVQAWRAGSWSPGIFSIASFVLTAHAAGTKLVFDHTGFPNAAADHLAAGWYSQYWEPMKKFFAG